MNKTFSVTLNAGGVTAGEAEDIELTAPVPHVVLLGKAGPALLGYRSLVVS